MRALALVTIGAVFGCGAAAAAGQTSAPDSPDEVHVNAIRDAEARKYKVIVAGMDAFEKHHRLAPHADALRFGVERQRRAQAGPAPVARLEGDDGFVLPLPIDAAGAILMPRSEPALDANSELVLNQKRRDYRIEPRVRSPGLPEHVRRLGDLRLECQVRVAMAKEEIGLMWTLTINSLLLSTDWCGFMKDKKVSFSFQTPQAISKAYLEEGNRSRDVEFSDKRFSVPLYDARWSDDALIQLSFEPADPAPPALTGTAGETPRTAP